MSKKFLELFNLTLSIRSGTALIFTRCIIIKLYNMYVKLNLDYHYCIISSLLSEKSESTQVNNLYKLKGNFK